MEFITVINETKQIKNEHYFKFNNDQILHLIVYISVF